ncbi:helix-turn-helix domain-containing protein [Thioclava sp. GXIMD4216]|uniref:TrmB family transcriptional regulator n=1 Tax=Thioclava sp. GXIMD4216 TaxID=3131929 RepID=UPI0030D06F07
MSADNPLITSLGALGFSQYEARAYCALLAGGAMNGNEVAKASGVPSPKIYETLGRLIDKGAALSAQEDPVRYAARPWDEVSEALKAKLDEAAQTVTDGLAALEAPSTPGMIWSLPDRRAVLSMSERLIGAAKEVIFAAVWDEEVALLGPVFEAAAQRGCRVHLAIYGTAQLAGPMIYDLTVCGVSAMERMAGRRLMTLVADGRDALVAEFHPGDSVEAVRTDSSVIGLLATEYVKADVLGRLLIDEMGEARFEEIRYKPGDIDALLRS